MKSSLHQFSELFRFDHEEIEKDVSRETGSYQGIQEEALYTASEDFYSIFNHHLVKGTFCDLGCGTGMSVLLYGTLFPEREAIGIEFQGARLGIGKSFKERHNLSHVNLIEGDLSQIEIPDAETYFLYFPTGPILDRILTVLYQKKKKFTLVAIESHGDLLPRLTLENWLILQDEIVLESKRYYPKAKIYQNTNLKRDLSLMPFEYSFKEYHLLISKNGEEWLAETFGLEWTIDDQFELSTPPRTIRWKDVKKILSLEEVEEKYRFAIVLRRKGELTIKTKSRSIQGVIRKIIVGPTFRVEISTGEKVEWSEIMTITQGSLLCYESSRFS
jgi:hypothetical protein